LAGFGSKPLPTIVTVVPAAPWAGEKLSIVGPVPEADTDAAKRAPAPPV
jgi:hypothetical protein